MTLTHTYTRTYTLLDAWASTLPWDCLIRDTNCCSSTHDHSPMVNDECAVRGCGHELRDGEECYAVTQFDGWVCWRHIRPDDGPIRSA